MAGWRTVIGVVLGAGLLASAVGGCERNVPSPTPTPEPRAAADVDAAAQIAALRTELAAARQRNLEFGVEVEWLYLQLETLAAEATAEAEATLAAELADSEESGAATAKWRQLLLDAGYAEDEIQRLDEEFDTHLIKVADLRNRAVRERWIGKPRFTLQKWALAAKTRSSLGDDNYDLYLYATGRPNRVQVSDVLYSSEAQNAGFEPGDILMSYDDRRVYRGLDVQRGTTRGKVGERVLVTVLRDGELIRLYPDRGTLGVQLKPVRRLPDNL